MIYGIIVTIIIIAVMVIVSLKGIFNYDYALTAIILVVTLSCFVEQHLLELSYNPFLLAALANLSMSKSEDFKVERKEIQRK